MNKIKKTIAIFIGVWILSGCSEVGSGAITLFLVDENGVGYGSVPYACHSGDRLTYNGETASNGEFTFYQGENCQFDLYGYRGTDYYDGLRDDLMYIVDVDDYGKNGIPYACEYFNVGYTNRTYDDGIWNGAFDYDADDRCTFYL